MNKAKMIFLLVLLFSSLTIDAQKDKATLFLKMGTLYMVMPNSRRMEK